MFRCVHPVAVLALCAAAFSAAPATAQETRITGDRASVEITLNGSPVAITRSDTRPCPPNCIQPLQIAADIATLGELEVLTFLETVVAAGTGLLIDTRTPAAYGAATIPGAVNVPEPTLRDDNPYRSDLLAALGVSGDGATARAYELVLFADSAATPDAALALKSLRATGYPAEKLHFYRAGFDGWTALGLSTRPGG